MNDRQLLEDYVLRSSQEAFAALVQRHINLVYSVALRCVGDPHQAQDVTQSVFLVLAQKAPRLHQHTVLTGWLYQTARLSSATFRRGELRRQRREQEAFMQSSLENAASQAPWEELAPVLDDALGRLGEVERNAILLRYFEDRAVPEVALALGLKAPAARKTLVRALEKLRSLFAKRGLATSASGLAAAIGANSVQAAPAGLAGSVASAIAVDASFHTAVSPAVVKAITMTTLQKTMLTAALVATVGAGLFEAHQATQWRAQNQMLQQEQASLSAQLLQLSQSLAEATNQLSGLLAENAQLKSNSNEHELLKLRGEVTQLRRANAQNESNDPTDEAAKGVAAKVKQLKQWLEQNPNERIPELQCLTAQDWLRCANYSGEWKTDVDLGRAVSQLRRDAKRTFANAMGEALANYIAGNNGQLPSDMAQLGPYFNPPMDGTVLQRYQLLQTGNLSDIPSHEPLIAEKAPVDEQYDTLFKISASGFSYQGTGASWVNGSGKGDFGPNITAKIKPFERPYIKN